MIPLADAEQVQVALLSTELTSADAEGAVQFSAATTCCCRHAISRRVVTRSVLIAVSMWVVQRGYRCSVAGSDRLALVSMRCIARPAHVSRMALVEDANSFSAFAPGCWATGRVNHYASYGAWIDVALPNADQGRVSSVASVPGLLHRTSSLEAGTFVGAPGEEVRVRIVNVDPQTGHLSLSSVSAEEDVLLPLDSDHSSNVAAFEGIFACEWLEGRVKSVAATGVTVVVEHPSSRLRVEGFCPMGNIDRSSRAPLFRLGETVHVRVVDFGPHSLSLSMKGSPVDIKEDLEVQLKAMQERARAIDAGDRHDEREPRTLASAGGEKQRQQCLPDWQDLTSFLDVQREKWLAGKVHHVASYGVFVTLPSEGHSPCGFVWGLVHLSELQHGIQQPLAQGDEVSVRIVHADVQHGTIALSMRDHPLEAAPTPLQIQASTWFQGVVKEVAPFGIFVEITMPMGSESSMVDAPSTARGLVYATEFEQYLEDPSAEFSVGDEVQVRITDAVGSPDGLLAMSMRLSEAEIQADVSHQEAYSRMKPEIDVAEEATSEGASTKIRQLKAFLDLSPAQSLRGLVQFTTPFGMLVEVSHPSGQFTAQGLLTAGIADELQSGCEVRVRVGTVDSHRGLLGLVMA